MDNDYTSPELLEELYFRETYACGTVRNNRKGMPITVKAMNIKPLGSAFLRNGPCLCLHGKGAKSKTKKKPVTLLSTIYDSHELLTKKKRILMVIEFPNQKLYINIQTTCLVLIFLINTWHFI